MFYYVGAIAFDSDLAHHGIKNQKWGRRRYQNEDGSLTSLGYEHYYGENGISKDAQRRREKKNSMHAESTTDYRNQSTNTESNSRNKKKKSKESTSEYRTEEEKELMNAKNNVGEIMVYGTEDENGKRVKARITVETANGIIENTGKIPMSELISKGGLKDSSAYKDILKAYEDVFVDDLPKDYGERVKSDKSKKKKKSKYAESTIDYQNQNDSLNSKKKKKKTKAVSEEITFGGEKIRSISNGRGHFNYGY